MPPVIGQKDEKKSEMPKLFMPGIGEVTKEKLEKLKKEADEQEAKEQKDNPLLLKTGEMTFTPQMSDGFMEQQTGFYVKIGDKWVVSELTYFSGVKEDEKGKSIAVMPYLLYNKSGERGFLSPELKKTVDFCGRRINLTGGTTLTKTIPTLMSFETAKDFINGKESESLQVIYPLLKERQAKFISFSWDVRLYDLMACISIATFFFDVFGMFGITFFYGPGSTGKGRALKTLVFASHRGIVWVNPSEPTIFRGIDSLRPTLGLDEFTRFQEIMMQLLRTAYKTGETVPRSQDRGNRWSLDMFETFCPLGVATTSQIDRVTLSRGFQFLMKAGEKDPNPNKKDPTPYDFEDIRAKLYLLRLTTAHKVEETMQRILQSNELPEEFSGRDCECFLPALTIAKMVSPEAYQNVLAVLKEHIFSRDTELYLEEKQALSAIAYISKVNPGLLQSPTTIISFYPKELAEVAWNQRNEQASSTEEEKKEEAKWKKHYAQSVGSLLKRMTIVRKYTPKGSQYSLSKGQLKDLCRRFSMPLDDSSQEKKS